MKRYDVKGEPGHRAVYFDSMGEWREWLAKQKPRYPNGGDSWAGGTYAQALAYIEKGDPKSVSEIEPLLDRYALELAERLPGAPERMPDVWGQSVRMGAYIAGEPLSMSRERAGEAPRAVRVWLDLGSSAYFDAESVLRPRAVAAAALCLYLSRLQPVELWAGCYCEPETSKASPKIRASEAWTRLDLIDVSQVAAIAQPCVCRQTGYASIIRIAEADDDDSLGRCLTAHGRRPAQYRVGDLVIRAAWPGECGPPADGDWTGYYARLWAQALRELDAELGAGLEMGT